MNGIIDNYYKKHGAVPTINELAEFSGNKLSRGACHVLLRDYTPPATKETPPKKQVKSKPKKKIEPGFVFIRVIFLFVSLTAGAVSIYYSFLWLRSYMIAPFAFTLSTALVTFSVTGFSASRYTPKLGVKTMLIGLSISVLLFSVVCTVAGQIAVSTGSNNKIENLYIDQEIMSLDRQILQHEEDLTQVQVLLSEFDTMEERKAGGGNYYHNTKTDRDNIQNSLMELNNQLIEKIREKSGNDTEDTFFSFLAQLKKDRLETFKFILYLIPAVFLDVIAPLGLYVSLEMRGKNGN